MHEGQINLALFFAFLMLAVAIVFFTRGHTRLGFSVIAMAVLAQIWLWFMFFSP